MSDDLFRNLKIVARRDAELAERKEQEFSAFSAPQREKKYRKEICS